MREKNKRVSRKNSLFTVNLSKSLSKISPLKLWGTQATLITTKFWQVISNYAIETHNLQL